MVNTAHVLALRSCGDSRGQLPEALLLITDQYSSGGRQKVTAGIKIHGGDVDS